MQKLFSFGYKLLTFFVKSSNLDVGKNTFYVLLVKILHLEKKKKTRNIYTRMLEFIFQGEDVIDQKRVGWVGRGVVIKRGRWNI